MKKNHWSKTEKIEPPMKGKHHSEKTKQKIREKKKKPTDIKCDFCGKKRITSPSGYYRSKYHHFCSLNCFKKWQRKENHPNWIDGRSYIPYSLEFKQLREPIRNRFNRICQLCGSRENKRNLDIHHIDYNRKNNSITNLIPLCQSCNLEVNKNRNFWENHFKLEVVK